LPFKCDLQRYNEDEEGEGGEDEGGGRRCSDAAAAGASYRVGGAAPNNAPGNAVQNHNTTALKNTLILFEEVDVLRGEDRGEALHVESS
jgi:hypothetical protein